MNIGYIIICRYNSKRLPGKILKEINGKPILQYIVDRLKHIVNKQQIVVATSNETTDNPIVEYCKNQDINYYRGSLENVSKRFLDCANHFQFDYACRTNGDNLFGLINLQKKMHKIAELGTYDFISNVKGRTYPKGMSIEIVKTSYYQKEYQKFDNQGHFEHVTSYLYLNDSKKNHKYIFNEDIKGVEGIQLAIDDEKDFQLATIINGELNDECYSLEELYKVYKKYEQTI